jgi:hypothetical protein
VFNGGTVHQEHCSHDISCRVPTKRLRQQAKRNADRFLADFKESMLLL